MTERKNVTEYINKLGYEVIDSMVTEHAPETLKKSVWYLGESLKHLSKADAVFFCHGWENNDGCMIEHEVCKRYGIPEFYEMRVKDLETPA